MQHHHPFLEITQLIKFSFRSSGTNKHSWPLSIALLLLFFTFIRSLSFQFSDSDTRLCLRFLLFFSLVMLSLVPCTLAFLLEMYSLLGL